MTPEQFFAEFAHIADAPNGVQKLRELILQLAVRGKLVPQDPNDEPAAKLLERIQAEKAKLVKEKKIRKSDPLPPVSVDGVPYEVPQGWEWVRLNETGQIFNGNSVNDTGKMALSKISQGLPFVATKDVGYGRQAFNYENGLKVEFGNKDFKVAHSNAVLICAEGGSAGKKMGMAASDICFGNKLYANEVLTGVNPRYILYFYMSPHFYEQFSSRMTGIIGGIARSEFLMIPTPLPPEKEQHRIVAKVDHLMDLCDELETKQAKKQQKLTRLNNAAIESLLTAREQAEFSEAWGLVRENFDLIYTTPGTISKLRQAILQLAVQGKLVPQDPSDEPASALVKQLKPSMLPDVDQPFDVPQSWEVVRLADLAAFGPKNGYSPKPVEYETGVRSLTLSATTKGKFDCKHYKFIDECIPADSYLWLKDGDILIQRGNSIEYVGIAAIYRGDDCTFIYPDLMMKIQLSYHVLPEFVHLVINCNASRLYFQNKATGTSGSMPKVNQAIVNSLPVPLPPSKEQRRIVAKVDRLMALCDEIESRITKSQSKAEKLSSATVQGLLAA